MEKHRPRMMVELEKKGWTWITNEHMNAYSAGEIMWEADTGALLKVIVPPQTEEGLIKDYNSRGFKEVLVTDAFDAEGNYLPRKTGIRAVYAKHPQVSKADALSDLEPSTGFVRAKPEKSFIIESQGGTKSWSPVHARSGRIY